MIRIRSAVNLHGQDLHLIVTDVDTGASLEFTLPPALAWTMLQGGEVMVRRDALRLPTPMPSRTELVERVEQGLSDTLDSAVVEWWPDTQEWAERIVARIEEQK